MTLTHLWQFEHPYHAAAGDYSRADADLQFEAWDDFAAYMDRADPDFNVLWRWDWFAESDRHVLYLFYVAPRLPAPWSAQVTVIPDDESAVRAFLTEQAAYLRTLWTPFLPA